jgi:hypothetical protein
MFYSVMNIEVKRAIPQRFAKKAQRFAKEIINKV